MAEAVLNWTSIMSAIETELQSVNSIAGAALFNVIPGEPLGLPLNLPDKAHACFWYLGRTRAETGGGSYGTLGNVMYAARIQIQCFFPVQNERATLSAQEAEIATADTSIRRALHANSNLDITGVTDLRIGDSELAYDDLARSDGKIGVYRRLSMELRLDNLEGEAIVQ